MSKTVKLTCNCGCGASVINPNLCGWFTVSQLTRRNQSDDPKLKEYLYFSTLSCMEKWLLKAIKIIPNLQELAKELYPRGEIRDNNVPELFI